MPHIETNRRKIVRRLAEDGWVEHGGTNHALFRHPQRPGVVIVPRHATLTPGVARSIAKAAGWI